MLEAVQQAGAALISTLEYDDVLKRILEQVGRVVSHDSANIMLIEGEEVQLIQGVGYEKFGTQLLITSISLNLSTTPIFQRMCMTGQPEVIPDVEDNPEWVYSRPEHRWIKSYAGAPIRFRDQVIGFLNVNSATPGFFTQRHANQLLAFADQAAIAIQNARLYRQAQEELAERTRVEAELRIYQEQLEELVRERTRKLTQATKDAEEARAAAETANQAKSTFLANMSHELRSPLNAILGFAQVMARNPNIPLQEQNNLNIIQRSGEHLLTLINQVLTLSKIEAGRTTLNPNNFDLHRLLDDVQDMFQLRAEEKGLYLRFDQDEHLPRFVRTDEVKLRQVLINLLNNAIKFTVEGGVVVRVAQVSDVSDMSDVSEQHRLHFEIEDTGPGIAPEEMGQVFEAFGQTETGRQSREGTGLGLPISRKFVQLMGGDMYVASQVGHGTTFTFAIQCELADSNDRHQTTSIKRAIALEPGQARYRLLIVGDQPDNRRLLAAMLTPFGFDLREATNGQQAIDLWEQWKPHLICMEMRMPVMDGYEAAQRIRELERRKAQDEGQRESASYLSPYAFRPVPIIALTASSFEEERARILARGCDDYLSKPFREEELFELISKHLDVRFVYEEGEGLFDSSEDRRRAKKVLTPESLAGLSAELLARLEQGALEANPTLLLEIIDQIRGHDAVLADVLAQLTDDFEYDKILAVLQSPKKPVE